MTSCKSFAENNNNNLENDLDATERPQVADTENEQTVVDNYSTRNEETPLLGAHSGPERNAYSISRGFLKWRTSLHIITHFLILCLTFTYWYWSISWGPVMLFSWHPGLMITGVVLVLEAVMIFHKKNFFTSSLPYSTKLKLHWILQIVGMLCLLSGFIIVVKFVQDGHEEAHFSTYHGQLGLATIIFITLTAIFGVAANSLNIVQSLLNRLEMKVVHVVFATTTIVLATTTIFLSFYSHWFDRFYGKTAMRYMITAVLPITAILVLLQPFTKVVKRIKRILVL